MTEQDIEDLLTRFTNRLRFEQPLDVSKLEDEGLYVTGLHGGTDAVARLRKDILRVAGEGVFLFTGQPGSGKSTELQRLRRDLLERPAHDCKVYYCDLEEWLNLNAPVTLSSFLVALLSSWVDQVGSLQGQRSPAERLIDFFTGTRLVPESLKLDAGAGPLKAQIQLALQTDDSFRKELEANLKKQQSRIVTQAHQLVADLKHDLCANGERCVLLADSVEKIRGYGDEAGQVYESVQRLFVSEGAALRMPGLHVVYSVSPFLLEQNTQLAASLGTGFVVNMPSVHVFAERSRAPDVAGLAAMQALVARRFPEWSQVFTPAQLQRLAENTGGDLRDFLRAIRVALSDDIAQLPVSDATVDFALGHVSPGRAIPAEHVRWLARLDNSHDAELAADIDANVLQRYLATKHVLAYLNGSTWYAVHPMAREWVHQRAERLTAEAAAQAPVR
ncbi:KAP family NTPase [Aquabacterium sp. OR-4]|uniref:KAP family NTPase n=1 Tax=Aquabacterium sp. OR-4 TaxID=2978127 RepID=UPI0021B2C009|nr:KAP family NTPase [Aquabacterium sp. OR-4]MDT7835529.1 KAP family NTPase [Aquabacterium sp. OR-4]